MRFSTTLSALALAGALLAAAGPVAAHDLSVTARVEGDEVVAEARYTNGNPVRGGSFDVYDGDDVFLIRVEAGPDGIARFPVEGAEGGLRIEMDAGDGHYDYWILTPADIAAQRAP